jgi:hypothetical protein
MPRWLDGRSGKVECSLYSEQGERKKPDEPLYVHTVDMKGGFMWDEGLSLEDIYDGGFVDDHEDEYEEELRKLKMEMEL